MTRNELGGRVPAEAAQMAHRILPITGLMPESIRTVITNARQEAGRWIVEKTQVHKPDNLGQKLSEVDAATQQHPWLEKLFLDAASGNKSAIFIIGLGAISIIAATGAGVEFGVRGGKDLKGLYQQLQEYRSTRAKASAE